MKEMTSINIDKWRTLNIDLFKGYIQTYKKLSEDKTLDPAQTLINEFDAIKIKGSLTTHGYGTAYTIAREIGVYYQDDDEYVLSNMSKAYIKGELTYSDFLKYYCLNIEFLINNEIVHPFEQIIECLKNNHFDKEEISQRVTKLIPSPDSSSAKDCLRLFLNRAVEAQLLKKSGNTYSLAFNYNILKGSINKSIYSIPDFESTFIKGNQSIAQKNIVKKLLEREIPNLFESSFTIKSKNPEITPHTESDNHHNFLNDFSDWLIQNEGVKHNYLKDSFSSNKENLIQGLENYQGIYETQFGEKVFSFPKSELKNQINKLEKKLYLEEGSFFEYSSKISNHMPRAILGKKNYIHFLKKHTSTNLNIIQADFNINQFESNTHNANLKYSNQLITRYISSLATKPFVLLSGLSGSGKTKLAQSFAQWICEDSIQYCIVPVGADWTNREPLLGYVNALDTGKYILPENGALQLIIEANKEENKDKPYFLILDEMNLSHVERYFADFLSVMESRDKFKLHSSDEPLIGNKNAKVEKEYSWPKNLFVVGTVNIDETTYMFSPKVLDRANVVEFRINKTDMDSYLTEAKDVSDLNGEGKSMGKNFVAIATNKTKANPESLKTTLNNFFITLQEVGAEFGYRTASEIQTLFGQIDVVNPDFKSSEDFKKYFSEDDYKIDIAIMQKLLPKLHGSRSKLTPVLKTLATLCYQQSKEFTEAQKDKVFETREENTRTVQYPISLEKITRMYHNVISNGFTSYAEA